MEMLKQAALDMDDIRNRRQFERNEKVREGMAKVRHRTIHGEGNRHTRRRAEALARKRENA